MLIGFNEMRIEQLNTLYRLESDFMKVTVVDISNLIYIPERFVNFLAAMYRKHKFRIIYPEQMYLRARVSWIECLG